MEKKYDKCKATKSLFTLFRFQLMANFWLPVYRRYNNLGSMDKTTRLCNIKKRNTNITLSMCTPLLFRLVVKYWLQIIMVYQIRLCRYDHTILGFKVWKVNKEASRYHRQFYSRLRFHLMVNY